MLRRRWRLTCARRAGNGGSRGPGGARRTTRTAAPMQPARAAPSTTLAAAPSPPAARPSSGHQRCRETALEHAGVHAARMHRLDDPPRRPRARDGGRAHPAGPSRSGHRGQRRDIERDPRPAPDDQRAHTTRPRPPSISPARRSAAADGQTIHMAERSSTASRSAATSTGAQPRSCAGGDPRQVPPADARQAQLVPARSPTGQPSALATRPAAESAETRRSGWPAGSGPSGAGVPATRSTLRAGRRLTPHRSTAAA